MVIFKIEYQLISLTILRQENSWVSGEHVAYKLLSVSQFIYCTIFSAHTQSAGTFEDMQETSGTNYQRTRASSGTAGGAKNMASRFNAMAKAGEEEARQRAEEERQRRQAREQAEREKNAREEERRQEEIAKQHAAMPVSITQRAASVIQHAANNYLLLLCVYLL